MEFITNSNNNSDLLFHSIDNSKSFYSIILENKEGDKREIRIFNNSDPLELAFNFCKENNLDCNYMKFLKIIIQKLKSRLSIINYLDKNSRKEIAKEKFFKFEDKNLKIKNKHSNLEIIPEYFKIAFNKNNQIDDKSIKDNKINNSCKNKLSPYKKNQLQREKEFTPNKLLDSMNKKLQSKILNIEKEADYINRQCLLLKLMNDKKNNQNTFEKIKKSINSNKHNTFDKNNNKKSFNNMLSKGKHKSNIYEIKTKQIPKNKLNSAFSRNKDELLNISQQYQDGMKSIDDKIYSLTEYIINKFSRKNKNNNYRHIKMAKHKKKSCKKINFDFGNKIINKTIRRRNGNLTETNFDSHKNNTDFFHSLLLSDKKHQLIKFPSYSINGNFNNLNTKKEKKLSFITSNSIFNKTKKRIKQYSYQKLRANAKNDDLNKNKIKPISLKSNSIYKKLNEEASKNSSKINSSSNYSCIELSDIDKNPKNQIYTKIKTQKYSNKARLVKEDKKKTITNLNNNKNFDIKINSKLNGKCYKNSKKFLCYTSSSSKDDTLKHKTKKIFSSKIKNCQKKSKNNIINNGSSFIKKIRKISPFNFPNINSKNKFIKSFNYLTRTKNKENSSINRKKHK